MEETKRGVRVPFAIGTVTLRTLVGFFHLDYYERAILLNDAPEYEVGPITRYMTAEERERAAVARSSDNFRARLMVETENEHLRMLLINLTTAACPFAHDPDASEALIEAHREASSELGLPCGVTRRYLCEE